MKKLVDTPSWHIADAPIYIVYPGGAGCLFFHSPFSFAELFEKAMERERERSKNLTFQISNYSLNPWVKAMVNLMLKPC